MPLPSSLITTANLDAGADSAKLARADLLAAVQALNNIIGSLGTPGGIALLDASGLPTAGAGSTVPAGTGMEYWGSTLPSGWLWADGSAVSRTTYAALFAAIGTTYGAGDGTTTFNLPDKRGRVTVGRDTSATAAGTGVLVQAFTGNTTANGAVVSGLSPSIAGKLAVGMGAFGPNLPAGVTIASIDSATQVTLSTGTGVTAATAALMRFGPMDASALGARGGTPAHALTTAQMPAHTHNTGTTIGGRNTSPSGGETIVYAGSTYAGSNTGGDQAHPNVQPSIVANYIIKT